MKRRDFVKLAVGAGLYVPARSYFDLGAWAWPPRWGLMFPELRVIGEDGRILRDVQIEVDGAGRLCNVSGLNLADAERFEIQYKRDVPPMILSDLSRRPPIPTIEFDPSGALE